MFFFTQAAQTAIDYLLVSRNFREETLSQNPKPHPIMEPHPIMVPQKKASQPFVPGGQKTHRGMQESNEATRKLDVAEKLRELELLADAQPRRGREG
jgi:hypothetical protein